MEGKEISRTEFHSAKDLIKQTNRVSLNLQDSAPSVNQSQEEGLQTDEDHATRFELSLAMLTKCKEIVELLQQLFTLSMIKHPSEFDQKKNM